MNLRILTITLAVAALTAACGGRAAGERSTVAQRTAAPAARFDADSAFAMVERQVALGPRVPGSPGHKACIDLIVSRMKSYGADTVFIQRGTQAGTPVSNIIASFRGTESGGSPVLLLAHYDTRPHADEDADPSRRAHPIDGANDGASGVAVLLETGRQLGLDRPAVDVDLLFVDAEDGGTTGDDLSWCLGSQYFARNLHATPRYAILLDMVGGVGAQFHREYFSDAYSPQLLDRVWALARRIGEGDRFPNQPGGAVVDDHRPLQAIGIPAIDIVESRNAVTGTFPPHWHTLDDNISAISASTLGSVGRVVNTLIRMEKP